MLEKYYKYKVQYNNYIIFLKFGSFYEVFEKDNMIEVKEYKNNKYNEYDFVRIDKIYSNLWDRVNNNLKNILERIESIV